MVVLKNIDGEFYRFEGVVQSIKYIIKKYDQDNDYDDNSNLFSGAYLNYTTRHGIGASLVGKIASSGAGVDGGLHILNILFPFFFRVNSNKPN